MNVNTVNSSTGARPDRREVQRQRTLAEIRDTARQQLAVTGAAGLSMRAVAREMGLTAPALYRYYDDRDALLSALIVDAFTGLTAALEAARDSQPEPEPGRRLAAMCLVYRDWAIGHPHEFALVFGTPVPGFAAPEDGPTAEAGARFGGVFQTEFARVWDTTRFALPERGRGAALDRELTLAGQECGPPLPAGAMQVFLSSWGKLHGLISLELFGQLSWVGLADAGALFRADLLEIMREVGVEVDAGELRRIGRRAAG